MDAKLPTVSVIIPARDAAESLPQALDSIEAQDYPNIVDVVVAAATPRDEEAARGRALVVSNSQGDTPVGLNLAMAAARGEIIVRCDAQALLPSGYVRRAVATLETTGADNVGGMQIPVGRTAWEKAIAAAMRSPLGAGDARYRIGGVSGPVETVYLGVFRRDTLERVGGFDPQFRQTQDYELNHRILSSGGLVWFDPHLQVEYSPRSSLYELARQYFNYGRAKRKFSRKHPRSLRLRQLAAPILVVVMFGSILLSVVWVWALMVPALYVASLLVATRSPRVALALLTMHTSWGGGFILGGTGARRESRQDHGQ